MASAHREGLGLSRSARDRASLTERTEEIFRQASSIPQRCDVPSEASVSNAETISWPKESPSAGNSPEWGDAAR